MPAKDPKTGPQPLADALPALKERLLGALRAGAVVLLAILGIWVVAVAGAGGARSVCSGCHEAPGRAASTGPHATVSCDSCHAAGFSEWLRLRALEGSVMPISQVLSGGSGRQAARAMEDRACLRCHRMAEGEVLVSKGLAMRHDTCVRRSDRCVDCHGDTGHATGAGAGRRADMTACIVCHDDETAPGACETCHRGERPKSQYKTGSWAAVHLDGKGTAHGMGDLQSCRSCHAKSKCVSCHGVELPHSPAFPRTHGAAALKSRTSCLVCHEETGCNECHGMEMPHPDGFLPAHSKSTKDEQDPRCMRCHIQEDCDRCHVDHTHPGKATGYDGPYW